MIGRWLRRGAAEALTQDGSPEAVTRIHDRQVVDMALAAIRRLTNQECLNQVCIVWAETRHTELAEVIIEHGWIASAPVKMKVLSAMKTGKLDPVTRGRAEVVEPLLLVCDDADETIRHTQAVICMAMSPDGRVLVSGSVDRTLRVWRSELERLTSVPVGQTTQQDREWIRKTVHESDLTAGERVAGIDAGIDPLSAQI